MNVDQLLAAAKNAVSAMSSAEPLVLSNEWTQGRTGFGGITAAMLVAAAETKVEDDKQLLSVSTNFVGPLLANTPFSIEVEVLREGKNVIQLMARAIQEQQTVIVQQLCFGLPRPSTIAIEIQVQHQLSAPEQDTFLTEHPELAPAFIQNFDIDLRSGSEPFTGSEHSHLHGWMRFKQAPEAFGYPHVTCLVDAWPPTVLQQFSQFTPCSTISWYLEFVQPQPAMKPEQWLAYQCHTNQGSDGYVHTQADIWNEAGELVAISRQTVAVFG